MTRSRLAVIGGLNVDLTLHVDRLPGTGETVLSSAPAQAGLGGKGGNQAAAAAAFGAGVTMTGRVDDDEAGRRIRADLAGRGVDVSQVSGDADYAGQCASPQPGTRGLPRHRQQCMISRLQLPPVVRSAESEAMWCDTPLDLLRLPGQFLHDGTDGAHCTVVSGRAAIRHRTRRGADGRSHVLR